MVTEVDGDVFTLIKIPLGIISFKGPIYIYTIGVGYRQSRPYAPVVKGICSGSKSRMFR